ncbi:MAG: Txe/YoeB family addiction module toxin [Erysipelotrichaceae bacterium]|nr:Txe/YoeB family addiction module toxin [Erysipelotrichaceae bacterium]
MNRVFTANGWEDYVYWQKQDAKALKKINALLEDIARHGNRGLGKPEPLLGDLMGFYSRRINDRDRLIYRLEGDSIFILACAFITGSN